MNDTKQALEAIGKAVDLVEVFDTFARLLNDKLPPGRELALVKTKLDEARLWAMEAISRAVHPKDNG